MNEFKLARRYDQIKFKFGKLGTELIPLTFLEKNNQVLNNYILIHNK